MTTSHLRLPFLPGLPNDGHTARNSDTMNMLFTGGQMKPLSDQTGNAPLFKYAEPLSDEDGRKGGICARSGYWFPGHMLVEMDGKKMGIPFAKREPKERESWRRR